MVLARKLQATGNAHDLFHARAYRIVELHPERKHLIHNFDAQYARHPTLVQPYFVVNGMPQCSGGVPCESIVIKRVAPPSIIDACSLGSLIDCCEQLCIWRQIGELDEDAQMVLSSPLRIVDRPFPTVAAKPVFLNLLALCNDGWKDVRAADTPHLPDSINTYSNAKPTQRPHYFEGCPTCSAQG